MPEGHTLHRLARRHAELLVGRPVRAASPQGRFSDGAARIDGRAVTGVWAVGKHLFYELDGLPERLHVHLGLYGKFTEGQPPAPPTRGALRLRLETAESWLELRGPIACELLTPPEVDRVLSRLGPDPLDPGADPDAAWSRLHRSRGPLGGLLMDQSVLAGVGNVYRAEVLFRQRLDPHLPGRALPREGWEQLWADLVTLMRAGLRSGRIVTTAPEHRDRPRGRVRQQDAHYVYRRDGLPCRVCAVEVVREELAGRNLFSCPSCQGNGRG